MIKSKDALDDLRAKWSAVRKLTARGPTGAQLPGFYVSFPAKDPGFYNLPFLLAYAALEQSLATLADEGFIPKPNEKNKTLHLRMKYSEMYLPWQAFNEVDKGRKCRNDLAHDATLLTKENCLYFIQLIENEMKAWGIL